MARPQRFAEYVRFEVYIPVVYSIAEVDDQSGEEIDIEHALDEAMINRLSDACYRRFGGLTRANPDAPHPYKGAWRDNRNRKIAIDRLTWIFVLVKVSESENARQFFSRWKTILERETNQQIILITISTLHTIGDFL